MLNKGIIGKEELIVTEENTAKAVGSGGLEVFATPALIALAEKTAFQSVAEHLEEGQSTVGTHIDIKHIAATPVGMKVTCETELIEVNSENPRRLVFSVNVYDEVEKIAEGTHERFIIYSERFQNKANGKNEKL
jgi:predicted thioesterase